MVKALRKKFVIVTTWLMVIVFGILLITNYFYNQYWSDLDTLQMLEWVSDSCISIENTASSDSEILSAELTEEGNPIIGLVIDSNGNVLSKKMIGQGISPNVSNEIIDRIVDQDSSKYKVGSFIYTQTILENDNILIILMDTAYHDNNIMRVIGGVIMILGGILLLVLITFYLSRFVTVPAGQALEREKQFISDASHELKTPLGAISINAQALEMNSESSIHVKNIISEANRMNRLVERLLTLSKLEESNLDEKELFSCSDVLEEMALTYESVAYEKKIDYQYSIMKNITLNGNEDEIRQLIAILLDNAIKNTIELGIIHVNFFRKRDDVTLEVMNTGQGIKQTEIDHIFERFYSSDHSRNNNSFGLGLAIAKAIVERHDGLITAISEPGKRAAFVVQFKIMNVSL